MVRELYEQGIDLSNTPEEPRPEPDAPSRRPQAPRAPREQRSAPPRPTPRGRQSADAPTPPEAGATPPPERQPQSAFRQVQRALIDQAQNLPPDEHASVLGAIRQYALRRPENAAAVLQILNNSSMRCDPSQGGLARSARAEVLRGMAEFIQQDERIARDGTQGAGSWDHETVSRLRRFHYNLFQGSNAATRTTDAGTQLARVQRSNDDVPRG